MAVGYHQILLGQPEFLNWTSGPRRSEIALGRVVDLLRFRRKHSFVDLADRARDTGQWEVAVRLYGEALDRSPYNPPIWVQYGHALKEAGELRNPDKLAQAELAYRKALSLEAGAADPHLQLGHVLKLQGKIEEAQAAYLRAFVLDPLLPHPLEELRGLGWSEAQVAELQRTLPNRSFPENRQPITEQAWSGHFDAEWYLEQNEDVARGGMDPLEHFLKYGLKEGRKPNAEEATSRFVTVTHAEIYCLMKPSFGDEVALFVTHSPHGRLKPHVPHYLGSLKRHGIAVVLIVAADRPFTSADTELVNAIDGMFVRQNEGYDFAAWAHVLHLHPELFDAKILYLINDSLIGPTNDAAFGEVLARLRNSGADVVGLTENLERRWHLQSYFLALKPRALSSAALHKFLNEIVSYKDNVREEVISNFEIRFAPTLMAAGLDCQGLFRAPDDRNPTTYHWKHLLHSGFPFVKAETIRGLIPDLDIRDWQQLLAAQGYDVSLAERTLAEFSAVRLWTQQEPLGEPVRSSRRKSMMFLRRISV
jgi:hypothetical protein